MAKGHASKSQIRHVERVGWSPPVFKNFRSTDLLNAFVLNALVVSFIAIMVLVIDDVLLRLTQHHNWNLSKSSRRFISFGLAFVVGLFCYFVMWFFFGYGGGLLVRDGQSKLIV